MASSHSRHSLVFMAPSGLVVNKCRLVPDCLTCDILLSSEICKDGFPTKMVCYSRRADFLNQYKL